MRRELRKYDYVIPILSDAYMNDSFLSNELWQSWYLEQAGNMSFVLPVRLDDCSVPILAKEKIVDFQNLPFSDAFSQLVKKISKRQQIFVIMMFGNKELDEIYHNVIKIVAE